MDYPKTYGEVMGPLGFGKLPAWLAVASATVIAWIAQRVDAAAQLVEFEVRLPRRIGVVGTQHPDSLRNVSAMESD